MVGFFSCVLLAVESQFSVGPRRHYASHGDGVARISELQSWSRWGPNGRQVVGKMVALTIPVSAFVTLGLEHSVANMFIIPLAIFSGAAVTWKAFLFQNLLPVTLGNIVGGAVRAERTENVTLSWRDRTVYKVLKVLLALRNSANLLQRRNLRGPGAQLASRSRGGAALKESWLSCRRGSCHASRARSAWAR